MSLSADILTLNSALSAFAYGQSVVSENIANAQTTGYTAQVLNLAALPDFGGVAVAGVGSTRDVYLYNQLYGQLALQGYSTAQLSALSQLAQIIPQISNPASVAGLQGAMNQLTTAWGTLASASAAGATAATLSADQTAVVNSMVALAALFNSDSNQLYTLQQNLNTQLQGSISQVNSLEGQILSLNQQIVALGGNQSAQTSTLIDQREQDAQQLATLTGGSVAYDPNGALVVTNTFGTLVDATDTRPLEAIPSRTQPGLTDVGYTEPGGNVQDVTSLFTSGTIGGLLAGRANVNAAVLAINQMASGVIQFSNEVNMSAAGPNGSVNTLFYGNNAANISVNPVVAAAGGQAYVIAGNDPANPGNLAQAQAAMGTLNLYSEIETENPAGGGIENTPGTPINPNASIASQTLAGLWAVPSPVPGGGTMVINAGGNAINVTWTAAMTLNQVIAEINANSGGAVYATLQTVPPGSQVGGINIPAGQYVHLYSSVPLSVYDASGNLAQAMRLTAYATSTAPVNSDPTTGVNTVDPNSALNAVGANAPAVGSVDNPLALFTQPLVPPAGTNWTADVNGNPAATFTWNPSQSINTILAAIPAPAGTTLYSGFLVASSPATQANLLAQQVVFNAVPNGDPTAAQPLTSFSITDITGNLTQVLNLGNAVNPKQTLGDLATALGQTLAAAQSQQTQADNLVTATEQLQTAQSGVDLNAQLAQAAVYQNAYDAAVRMQYVLESMLNYLITGMGSPANSNQPVG